MGTQFFSILKDLCSDFDTYAQEHYTSYACLFLYTPNKHRKLANNSCKRIANLQHAKKSKAEIELKLKNTNLYAFSF